MGATANFTLFDSATLWLADGTALLKPTNSVKVCLVALGQNINASAVQLYGDLTTELPTGGGYTLGGVTLTGYTLQNSGSSTSWVFTGPTPKWSAVGSGIPAWHWAIFYVSGTINGHVNPLLGFVLGDPTGIDIPATLSGSTLDVSGPTLFTFSPTGGVLVGADADFFRRSTSAGVFRVFKFNDDTFLNLGLVKRPFAPGGYAYRSLPSTDNTANTVAPSIDHSVFASGTGSLHFQFPSQSGQDAAGSWQGDFSDDCTVQFGPATEQGQSPTGNVFYAQWQQMWDDAYLNTQINLTSPGVDGSKLCIICTGDIPPGWQALFPNGYLWGSCEKNEVVLERYGNTHYFQAFAECSGNEGFMGTGCQTVHVYWPMTATTGGGNFVWQNGMPQNACCWNNLKTLNGGTGTNASLPPRDLPGCFNLKPNVWYTIQIMIDCGPTRGSLDPNIRCSNYYARKFDQSRVKVWLGEK